jgi:tRNA pseudouridine55 synthase
VSAVSGLVVVDKPAGITSHDVVARIRRLAGTRKVGHAGTLDPMATGVLVLGINRATRLLGHLTLSDKTYVATIRLGASTTTDDAEGEILATADASSITEDQVRDGLAGMVGEIDQVPSTVSAIKVDGQRAYARVRAGEAVELPARKVTIHALTVEAVRRAGEFLDVDVDVRCSSGTYIRAIARDLGAALAVGGHLTRLRRTAVGPFADALTMEELAEDFRVVPIEEAARAYFPVRELDEQQALDVTFGRKLDLDLADGGPVAVFSPNGTFLALYEGAGEQAKAVAVFV